MSNIAFYSDNHDFISDLIFQVGKYAPEFKLCDNNDENALTEVQLSEIMDSL